MENLPSKLVYLKFHVEYLNWVQLGTLELFTDVCDATEDEHFVPDSAAGMV